MKGAPEGASDSQAEGEEVGTKLMGMQGRTASGFAEIKVDKSE